MQNNTNNNYTLDIIIPTYRPDVKFDKLITRLEKQTIKPNNIIIINTEEQFFNNEKYINNPLLKITHIKKEEFDHGGTRSFGAEQSNADIIMFMTQDAIPANENLIKEMLEPFTNEEIGAVYARQLPDENSSEIEKYTRRYNYPNESYIKSIEDKETLGIKVYFCSNVCAAYRTTYYKELGGFVSKTIFNEDMIMASRIINNGYKIAYTKNARVIHFHEYSYIEQLTRNFDLGVSHKQYEDVFKGLKSESEGIKLIKNTIKYLIKINKSYLIFDLIFQSGFKYIGYKLGYNYDKLPIKVVKILTMNKSYWE